MREIQEKLNSMNTELNTILSWNFYGILLTVENMYNLNNNLVAFTQKSGDFIPLENPDLIEFEPLDSEGFIDYTLDRTHLSLFSNPYIINNFLDREDDYLINDKFVSSFFKEFKYLTNRDERFSIYEKYSYGILPGYKKIINEWKNNKQNTDLDFISKEPIDISSIENKNICFPKNLNDFIQFNKFIREENDSFFQDRYFQLNSSIQQYKIILNLAEFILFVKKDKMINSIEFNIIDDGERHYTFSRIKIDSEENESIKQKQISSLPKLSFELMLYNYKKRYTITKDSSLADFQKMLSYNDIKDDLIKQTDFLINSLVEKHIISLEIIDTESPLTTNKKRI